MKNGEFKLIEELSKILHTDLNKEDVGIGDDCALINIGNEKLIVTVDSMTENVHFLREYDPKIVGERLTTINASDIASCGGKPLFGVISLNVPKNIDEKWIKDLYKGINKGAKKYGFSIVGGNTSGGKELTFALTLFGKTEKFISRSGAKKGESVFISGKTGLSKRGLELILQKEPNNPFINNHLKPKARVDLSNFLAKYASSAIDISDGLTQDLGHICTKSNTSINIDPKNFPISKKLIKNLGKKLALEYALQSGEDYEIAFTINPDYEELASKLGCYKIGSVISSKNHEVFFDFQKIKSKGYDHIKKS